MAHTWLVEAIECIIIGIVYIWNVSYNLSLMDQERGVLKNNPPL